MSTTIGFDVDALRRGIEGRDADFLASLYTEDAEMIEIDNDHPPARPRMFHGRSQIAEHLRDVCARDMSHRMESPVLSGGRLAYTEACHYDDGTDVFSMSTAELDSSNRISRHVGVTAWGM
jgi:hypothetical protein